MQEEHEILITTREFAYIQDMLDQFGIDAEVVGSHGGTSLEGRLDARLDREQKLLNLLKKQQTKPDIFIGKCSVEGSRIAYGLGIKSLIIADNEYGFAMNSLSLPLSTVAIVPEAIDIRIIRDIGAQNIAAFRGVCEVEHVRNFKPDKKILSELGINTNKKLLTMRTGPLDAHYFKQSGTNLVNYIQDLDFEIVALPRNGVDKTAFEKAGVIIPEHGIDALSLIHYSDIFLGEGGSMNREAALLGTPTISCYPQKLLSVDNYLIEQGLFKHSLDKNEIQKLIRGADKQESLRHATDILPTLESPIDKVRQLLDLPPRKKALALSV